MFAVGDVVVCVDAVPDDHDPKAALLKKGAIYRVAVVGILKNVEAIGFRSLRSDVPGKAWGWRATRFRPLRKASADFIASIRRPVEVCDAA